MRWTRSSPGLAVRLPARPTSSQPAAPARTAGSGPSNAETAPEDFYDGTERDEWAADNPYNYRAPSLYAGDAAAPAELPQSSSAPGAGPWDCYPETAPACALWPPLFHEPPAPQAKHLRGLAANSMPAVRLPPPPQPPLTPAPPPQEGRRNDQTTSTRRDFPLFFFFQNSRTYFRLFRSFSFFRPRSTC
jgi:hypothetical protein